MMRNNFWLGCILGLVLPGLTLSILLYTDILKGWAEQKLIAFFLLSIGANLIGMRALYRREVEKSARGLLLTTCVVFIYVFITNKHILTF